jgi:hypothetical protein
MKFLYKPLLGVLGLLTLTAQANDLNQFDYFGISIANHSYDAIDFSPQLDTDLLSPYVYKSTSSEIGGRGFIGHQFNQYLAIEAGITSFGNADFSVIEKSLDSEGKEKKTTLHKGSFSTLAGDLRIVATYPLSNNMFVKAQLGAVFWDNEFDTLSGDSELQIVKSVGDSGTSMLAGVGLGYGFNKKVAMSLDFETTKIATITTQTIGLSLIIRF